MDITIDIEGFLYLKRGGVLRQQRCPFAPMYNGELTPCGDWCPMFDSGTEGVSISCGVGNEYTCGQSGTFTDERK